MIKGLFKKIFILLIQHTPPGYMESILRETVLHGTSRLGPADALRFLFRLDEFCYLLEGQKSVEYGGDVHTKHRHTNYHSFFVRRIKRSDKVLDIGCGIGALAHDIAVKTGAHVIAIDLMKDNIDKAKQIHPHPLVEYVQGDILAYTTHRHFDVIVLSNVLEHLPHRPEFLDKINDLYKPIKFLIRVPLFERDWRVPLKKELGVEWRLDPTHEIEYTLESFSQEIRDAGLVISHQEVRWGEIWAEIISDSSRPDPRNDNAT